MQNKHLMFIKEYLVDLNGKRAAIRAGYSAKTAEQQASRLLSNVKIKQQIDKELAKRSEKLDISADWVLSSLKKIAKRCMQEEEVMKYDSFEKALVGTGEFKFDSSGANKSLELIGKHLKLFTEKQEVEVSGDITIKVELTDD